MSKPVTPGAATPRRSFLMNLVLAPAAAGAAACATSTGAARSQAAASPAAGADGDASEALRAIRAVPLGMDAEPAFVFRAAPARPAE